MKKITLIRCLNFIMFTLMFTNCSNQDNKGRPFRISVDIPETTSKTEQYVDSIGQAKTKKISFLFNLNDTNFYVNGKKLGLHSEIKDLISIIGPPERYDKGEITSYIFDSLGFYVNTYPLNRISVISMQFVRIPITTTGNLFSQELIINGQKISIFTRPSKLRKSINLKSFGANNCNYRNTNGKYSIFFDFVENKDSLASVYIAFGNGQDVGGNQHVTFKKTY